MQIDRLAVSSKDKPADATLCTVTIFIPLRSADALKNSSLISSWSVTKFQRSHDLEFSRGTRIKWFRLRVRNWRHTDPKLLAQWQRWGFALLFCYIIHGIWKYMGRVIQSFTRIFHRRICFAGTKSLSLRILQFMSVYNTKTIFIRFALTPFRYADDSIEEFMMGSCSVVLSWNSEEVLRRSRTALDKAISIRVSNWRPVCDTGLQPSSTQTLAQWQRWGFALLFSYT